MVDDQVVYGLIRDDKPIEEQLSKVVKKIKDVEQFGDNYKKRKNQDDLDFFI